jgi:3-hydroxyacyl-[acyl-carrier-protein] dehydratase
MIDINEITEVLPHRYPFLLIDRVIEITEGESIKAIKNVTMNEPFFPGHFPGHPVMPGVLIVEAMAQAGCFLALKSIGETDTIFYFMGIDKARFRRQVIPGDTLEFTLTVTKKRSSVWVFKGEAHVAGELVASAELMAGADKKSKGNK